MITLSNLRTILITLLIGLAIWLYKDYQFQKSENIRQTENLSQLRKLDSIKFATQVLNKDEIIDYLKYDNTQLGKNLEAANIKFNRIESIISREYSYKDNKENKIDMDSILKAIKAKTNLVIPFTDTTKCMTIKGFLDYKGDSLKLRITDRTFNNKSDDVVYWERKPWKFLFFKTRFLGKKQFTAKGFNECGESKTLKIEKKKP